MISSSKLAQWIDEKLLALKEYESLIIEAYGRKGKQCEAKQSTLRTLKRDIDILKSTVLQQQCSKSNANASEELKRVYEDVARMELELPILRKRHVQPLIARHVQAFTNASEELKRVYE